MRCSSRRWSSISPGAPLSVVLLGATAVGKDDVALPLAAALGAEIVSVDSIKVYRGMDIGTAKPGPEALRRVRHHLLDLVDPWESYSVGRFVADAECAETDIRGRGRLPLFVGGSGLYLRALWEGMLAAPAVDPATRAVFETRADREGLAALHAELARVDPTAARRIHPHDRKRILRALEFHALTGRPISAGQTHAGARRTDRRFLIFGLTRPRDSLYRRARARVDAMIAAGLVDEVRRLLADPRGLGPQAREAIGYRELVPVVRDGAPLVQAVDRIRRDTCHFIKRQETWFRKFADVRWTDLDATPSPEAAAARIREQADSVIRR